jgi:signal transduction histidine kinase
MLTAESKLKERVKELKCLYDLSRIAWKADNDLKMLLSGTLDILPRAMQYPAQAEARIMVGNQVFTTTGFDSCQYHLSSPLVLGKKTEGKVQIGYRAFAGRKKNTKQSFLPEEKKLIKTVARELSLFIRRSTAEAEKLNLQMQLQHVERLAFVGELSAGIAHELNEPLGRILGFAQLIKKGGGLNDQQHEDMERIIKASLYTREIIKKLMIFSRQMPPQISFVNLNEIVTSILYFIDARFESRKIKIIQRLDPDLPQIKADAVQMSQVLVNLITNAIHALPYGGEVIIMTKKSAEHVRLSVRDNGHGMTAEVRKKIFEPFFTTKPVGQGTGLGLSVVQGIVESHDGKISVTTAPGKGARFEVLLPANHSRK